jgi:hypothetical protein
LQLLSFSCSVFFPWFHLNLFFSSCSILFGGGFSSGLRSPYFASPKDNFCSTLGGGCEKRNQLLIK